jgi:hypothetical protein
MNQAGGKDSLMTYECEFPQAELGKGLNSTTERKSMSTKTTIKRIALVAVAALGLGVVSTVAPASATTPTTVTLGTPVAAAPAVTGVTQVINVPVTFTTAAATDTLTVAGVITAAPSTSGLALNSTAPIDAVAISSQTQKTTGTTFADNTSADNQNNIALGAAAVTSAAPYTVTLPFTWTPDKAGTYNLAFFIDGGSGVAGTGLIKAGDASIKYLSVTVKDQPATTAAISQPVAGTGAVYGATDSPNGLWVRVNATDGTALSLIDSGQQMLISIPSGLTLRKKAAASITSGLTYTDTTYALSKADFDAAGYAYLNFTAAAAGSFTVSASVAGQSAAAASVTLTYKAITTDATAGAAGLKNDGTTAVTPNIGSSTGSVQAAASVFVNPSVSGNTFIVYGGTTVSTTAAPKYVGVTLVDTNKKAFGNLVALTSDYVALLSTAVGDSLADGSNGKSYATFTVPNKLTASATSTENQYVLYGAVTGAAPTASAVTTVVKPEASSVSNGLASVTVKPATALKVVNGGSVTLSATYVDQYGNAKAGVAITAQITSGRNVQTDATNLVTDADGKVSFTVTDANPTSTTLTDVVTFTGGASASATITYVSALTATTLTTSPSATTNNTAVVAATLGAVNTADATASDGAVAVTATAKDAAGVVIAGLPVTITLPAGVSLKSTTPAVAYTNASGEASWSVYTTKAGTYEFTFTGGGLTKTSYGKFTAGTARNVSVTSADGSDASTVTIKVTDAYGNGVSEASVSVKATGGYFQGIPMTSTQKTDADGNVVVAFVGTGTVTATITGGQSNDLAGYVGTTAAAGFPAGNGTATAEVASTVSTSASVDAANEATDAANAATDAANAAAEAADAATAAAQDAQAAVAALATSVASLIAGIKAQITTLTNLVIKIQKKVRA